MKEKEAKLLEFQIILSSIFIITLIVSIFLTYDEEQKLLNKYRYITDEQAKYLELINRLIIIFIVFSFLYINIVQCQIDKEKGDSTKTDMQQILASILVCTSSLIILYVIFENWNENLNIPDVENPIS